MNPDCPNGWHFRAPGQPKEEQCPSCYEQTCGCVPEQKVADNIVIGRTCKKHWEEQKTAEELQKKLEVNNVFLCQCGLYNNEHNETHYHSPIMCKDAGQAKHAAALRSYHDRSSGKAFDEAKAHMQKKEEIRSILTDEIIDHVVMQPDGRVSIGTKDDSDKLSWGLIPWSALRPVVRVLMWGATKYGPENWRHVPDFRRRYFEAAMRHLTAWWEGEKADKDTGESHLAHLLCCGLFLLAKEHDETNK